MNAKAIAANTIKQEQALKKKKQRKRLIIAGVVCVLSYGVWWLFKPWQGGITFGVCKVFLELYVQNPRSLRLSTVDDFGDTVRIWFTQVDSFGEYRMEPIQCHFRHATPEDQLKYGNVSFVLDKVTVSRRELDPQRVARFNAAIPGIVANPPDMTLPTPLADSLQGLQIDSSMFRKPIL